MIPTRPFWLAIRRAEFPWTSSALTSAPSFKRAFASSMCPFKIASRRSPLDGPESTGAMKTASVVAGRGVVGLVGVSEAPNLFFLRVQNLSPLQAPSLLKRGLERRGGDGAVVVVAASVVVVVTLMGGTNLADVFIWGEGRLSGTETGTVRDCSDPDEVDEASHWQTACVAANSLFSLHRGSLTTH